MNIGKMKRRICIEQFTTDKDTFGQPIKTWAELKSVWADIRPLGTTERFEAAQVNRQVELRMRIHYRTDITEQMRILYEGDYYDIQGIKEIGYRQALELLCGLWKPEGG